MANLRWAFDLIDEREERRRLKPAPADRVGPEQLISDRRPLPAVVEPRNDYIFWFDQAALQFGQSAGIPRKRRPAVIVQLMEEDHFALVAPMTSAMRTSLAEKFELSRAPAGGMFWFQPSDRRSFVWREMEWVPLAACTRKAVAAVGYPIRNRLLAFLGRSGP